MSKRDETLLFEDILEAIGRIRECARGCSKEDFFRRGLSSPYTENLGSKPEETLFAKDQAERGRPRPSCQFTITVLPYRGGASGGCELARRSHGLRELLREAAAAGMEMGSARRRAGELR